MPYQRPASSKPAASQDGTAAGNAINLDKSACLARFGACSRCPVNTSLSAGRYYDWNHYSDQVLAQNLQGFAAGNFDELVRAIRNGAGYANVHSATFGAGEIRGQIRERR